MKLNKIIVSFILVFSMLYSVAWAEQASGVCNTRTDMKTYEQLFPDPYFAKLVAYYTNHDISDIAREEDLNKVNSLELFDGRTEIVEHVFDLTGISNLQNLESIEFSNSYIANIPDEIGNITSLKKINLSGNQIVHVTDKIGNLDNLEELYLDNNKISDFPSSILDLPNLVKYTNKDQDLLSGNVPVKFIPQSDITFDSNGAPILTNVVKSIPAPKGAIEIGGNLADEDPQAFNEMHDMVKATVKNLPVYKYHEYYIAHEGAIAKYGSGGELMRVRGNYEHFNDIDQYLVNGSFPDGRYVGNYSEFSRFESTQKSSQYAPYATITGYFTTYGDYWPAIPTSDTASNADPVPNRPNHTSYYGDRIGTKNNKLKIGDVAPRRSFNIAYDTTLTVTVLASDTNGSGTLSKSMRVRDIMGATAPVLDIWRWDNPEWFSGTPQNPNDIYFGQKYNTYRSFPNTGNYFTY